MLEFPLQQPVKLLLNRDQPRHATPARIRPRRSKPNTASQTRARPLVAGVRSRSSAFGAGVRSRSSARGQTSIFAAGSDLDCRIVEGDGI